MKTFKQLSCLGAILAAAIAPSQAAPITIPNYSFESPGVSDGGVGTPSSWTFIGSGGSYNSVNNNFPLTTEGSSGNLLGLLPGTADGVNYAYIYGFMYQTLTDVFLPDTTYTFTLALGNNAAELGTNNVYFGLYSAADAPSTSPLGTLTAVDTNNTSLIPSGSFSDFTFTYTTPSSGGPVGTAIQLGVWSGEQQGGVDNARLTYAVPEPSTLSAMIVGGLIFLIAFRVRRCHHRDRRGA